jgi:hypothetical protein
MKSRSQNHEAKTHEVKTREILNCKVPKSLEEISRPSLSVRDR